MTHFEPLHQQEDAHWMRQAILEAQKCLRASNLDSLQIPNQKSKIKNQKSPEDVPVGAVCVFENEIIGRGWNQREARQDPTAHAEVLALREAARAVGDWRLKGVALYVTLEPCPMCAGAIWLARIERLVFGAWDEKAGACGSLLDLPREPRLNHRLQVKGGVLEGECAALLTNFFASKRNA